MRPKIAHWIAALYLVLIDPFLTWEAFFVFCGALLFSCIYLAYILMDWWIEESKAVVKTKQVANHHFVSS